ncbi:MAG TPA: hypothetical protein VGG19_05380 [Tepidisphaeraceae bacterium]
MSQESLNERKGFTGLHKTGGNRVAKAVGYELSVVRQSQAVSHFVPKMSHTVLS